MTLTAVADAVDADAEDVFLTAYLAPFQRYLTDESVCEVMVNQPGEVWIERAGGAMERHTDAAINPQLLRRLAEQIARFTHQGVNREQPLLGATLPCGVRLQFIGPPATRSGWALAIRRHRLVDVPLAAWRPGAALARPQTGAQDSPPIDSLGWIADAVRRRQTVLISGGTSSGKTTFLNTLLREIDPQDRVILIEDTPEIHIRAPNALGLVAVKGALGEARVTVDDLLQASLRMRPDRIVLGELRGGEAVTFLRAINTGHPGSFTTIHANSCRGALDQLALMTMQAGLGLSHADAVRYACSVIDIVVQLRRESGQRQIVDIRSSHELLAEIGH